MISVKKSCDCLLHNRSITNVLLTIGKIIRAQAVKVDYIVIVSAQMKQQNYMNN